MTSIPIPTEHGTFLATFSERGLASLDFPMPGPCRAAADLPGGATTKLRPDLSHWAELVATAIACTLEGRKPLQFPPLDVSAGTDFQQAVWKALQRIPPGASVTYSDVAGQLGKPAAVRAVGGACGANPIPILIPCHRVLAKGGKLGGFSAGLEWKRILLAREGIKFVE